MSNSRRLHLMFQLVSSLPAEFEQIRARGHPLVGDSPIRAEFDTGDEYVRAWHQWRRMSEAYRREERLYGEEYRVYLRTNATLRAPELLPYLDRAGLI